MCTETPLRMEYMIYGRLAERQPEIRLYFATKAEANTAYDHIAPLYQGTDDWCVIFKRTDTGWRELGTQDQQTASELFIAAYGG